MLNLNWILIRGTPKLTIVILLIFTSVGDTWYACLLRTILGALDHAVAFLNHVGISRNTSQVIILHNKFTRGTPVHE